MGAKCFSENTHQKHHNFDNQSEEKKIKSVTEHSGGSHAINHELAQGNSKDTTQHQEVLKNGTNNQNYVKHEDNKINKDPSIARNLRKVNDKENRLSHLTKYDGNYYLII